MKRFHRSLIFAVLVIAILLLAAPSTSPAADTTPQRATLYPGIMIQQHGDHWDLGMEITLPHGRAYSFWCLTRTMPEIQDAVNAWCANAAENPPVDQSARITSLMYQIERLQQEIGVKQATIDAMNTNYAEQEKRIRELTAQVTDLTAQLAAAQKKQSGGSLFYRLFGR